MPRPSYSLQLWLLTLGGILASLLPAQQVCAQAADTGGTEASTQTLIFLRSEYPVFVQLTVLLDGQELRELRSQRVTRAFKALDANGDGTVDQAESEVGHKALRELGIRGKWRDLLPNLDNDPRDNRLSAVELTAFADQLFGPPVVLGPRPKGVRRSGQAVELFDLLDGNQDQIVSEAEFAILSSRLQKLDADGDESFSVVEVEPFRNPFSPRTGPTAGTTDDAPWIVMDMAAEILLKRFDKQPPQQVLNSSELGFSQELIRVGDTDHDGALNLLELQKLLPQVPPHYRLKVNIPMGKTRLTNLTWTNASATSPEAPLAGPAHSERLSSKGLEAEIAGQPLQLQVSTARASQADNVAFYKLQFRKSDRDKNKYLDKTEFSALNLPGATFETVDADGNGQVFDREIEDFLNQEQFVDQAHVVVTYDHNEQSLFALLDLNKDNRLSPRECLNSNEAWRASDKNQDGQLSRSELSGNMRLTVELAKPRLFQNALVPQGAMTGEPLIRSQASSAPAWFRGMDRNVDGDISRREFIGNAAAFRKWDRDGDGLISTEEAGK